MDCLWVYALKTLKCTIKQIVQKDKIQKAVILSHFSLRRSLENSAGRVIVVNKWTKLENTSDGAFKHRTPPTVFRKIKDSMALQDFALVIFIGKVQIFTEPTHVTVQCRILKKVKVKLQMKLVPLRWLCGKGNLKTVYFSYTLID